MGESLELRIESDNATPLRGGLPSAAADCWTAY